MAYKRVIKALQGFRKNYIPNIKIVSRAELWDRLEWIALLILVPLSLISLIIIYRGLVWIIN